MRRRRFRLRRPPPARQPRGDYPDHGHCGGGGDLNAYALVGDFKDRTEALERIVVLVAAIMLIVHSHDRHHRRGAGRGRPGPAGGAAGCHGQRNGLSQAASPWISRSFAIVLSAMLTSVLVEAAEPIGPILAAAIV